METQTDKKVIQVAVVDDHLLFRQGLAQIVTGDNELNLWGEASNGLEFIALLKKEENTPDVVLLDLKMPEMDGIETLEWIKENRPELKVLILTMHEQDDFVLHLVDLGANGYLLKNAPFMEVKKAVVAVYEKEFYFNEFVSSVLLKGVKKKKTPPQLSQTVKLSPRETEVLQLIAQELTNPEIADKLFLSVRTVESHRKSLLEKLNAKNTAGLILKAVKMNLLTL